MAGQRTRHTEFLKLLVKRIGRQEKLHRIVGHMLTDNTAMQRVSRNVGFESAIRRRRGEWRAEIVL